MNKLWITSTIMFTLCTLTALARWKISLDNKYKECLNHRQDEQESANKYLIKVCKDVELLRDPSISIECHKREHIVKLNPASLAWEDALHNAESCPPFGSCHAIFGWVFEWISPTKILIISFAFVFMLLYFGKTVVNSSLNDVMNKDVLPTTSSKNETNIQSYIYKAYDWIKNTINDKYIVKKKRE